MTSATAKGTWLAESHQEKQSSKIIFKAIWAFPLWLKRLRTGHSFPEDAGSISGLAQWLKDPMLLLLWLWYRPSAAALIRPLTWELPYGVAVKTKIKGHIILFLFKIVYMISKRH